MDGQSPEAISGRMKYHEKTLPDASKDVIYQFLRSLYGKIIGLLLKKKKRPVRRKKATELKDRIFIDKRPKIIDNRAKIGDVEADFIVSGRGGKGIMLTVICRKIRAAFLEIIYDVSVDEVHKSFVNFPVASEAEDHRAYIGIYYFNENPRFSNFPFMVTLWQPEAGRPQGV